MIAFVMPQRFIRIELDTIRIDLDTIRTKCKRYVTNSDFETLQFSVNRCMNFP